MSPSSKIARYMERSGVIPYRDISVVKPEATHPGWTNFAAQRAVRSIAIGTSGDLWLATWGGVLHWDRSADTCFRFSGEHGLASNAVSSICVDAAGQIWAGHDEGGLSCFDTLRWRAYDHLHDEPIRCVCAATDGGIWAAGPTSIYRITDLDCSPRLVAQDHDGAIDALTLLADGDFLLLGNAWGLFRLRSGQEPERVNPADVSACTALARDDHGRIWIGTPDAIYQLDGTDLCGPFGPDDATALGRVVGLTAGSERAWVLTTEALAQVSADRWLPVVWPDHDRRVPAMRAIAAGSDAYLWVGTDDGLAAVSMTGAAGAVWDFDLLPRHAYDAISSLGRCAAVDLNRRRRWIGTANGLLAFNEDTGCEPFPGLAADVRAMTFGSNQGKADNVGLWLLTRPYGIVYIADDGRVDLGWPQPPGIAAALALGNDGRPYAVTTRALWRLGPDEPVAVSGPAPDMITCLAQASDGLWWLGTAQGLFSLVNGGWQLAGEQPGPLQAEVFAFTVSAGCLWVATDTGLWARPGNAWQRYGASDPVFAVAFAEGSGALWLADEHGIVRYDPASGASTARYTPFNSGLGSRRIVALAESAGALWIVTQAGVSRLQLH